MSCNSDCSKSNVACVNACATSHPNGGIGYRLCVAGCNAVLAGCYAKCFGEEVLDDLIEGAKSVARAMEDGLRWLADHPEVVIGTIIVIAGVTLLVVATGGSAAPALVLVAA